MKNARRPINLPLCILLTSVALFSPCGAVCLPRNNTHLYVLPSSNSVSPPPSSLPSSLPSTSSKIRATPPYQQSPSPPQEHSPPPPSTQQSPLPPEQQSPQPLPTPNAETPSPSKPTDEPEITSMPFSYIPPKPGLVPGALKTTCQKLTHPEICMSTLLPVPPSDGGNLGMGTMLELLLETAKQQTLVAGQELAKLAAKPDTGKDEATMMRGCSERFNDAMDDYDSAIEAAKQSDIPTVQINLSAVLSSYSDCKDGDAPGDPGAQPDSPRAIYYDKLKMFIDNCFDLSSLLK